MNIQATLDKCRAELKRQQEVKQYQRSWSEKARLKVAGELLDFNGSDCLVVDGVGEQRGKRLEIVRTAAALLGVEVVA